MGTRRSLLALAASVAALLQTGGLRPGLSELLGLRRTRVGGGLRLWNELIERPMVPGSHPAPAPFFPAALAQPSGLDQPPYNATALCESGERAVGFISGVASGDPTQARVKDWAAVCQLC